MFGQSGGSRDPSRNAVGGIALIIKNFLAMSVVAALLLAWSNDSKASEGTASNYFPGSYGDVLIAAAPDPGWVYQNYNLFYDASVNQSVLQGRVNADIDTFSYANMSAGIYTFKDKVFGATFAMAAFVPIAYVDLDATLADSNGSVSVSDSVTGLGDISFMPASFYWDAGNWSFNLYENIIAPTGKYDVDDAVNVGLNHWSFDTVFAFTYFNPDSGFDFSMATGLLLNTKNDDTHYRTGNELHVDVMANQFLSETLAIGLKGYYYKQVTGDSGSGAILGDFKGDSYGVGPSLLWVPTTEKGNFSITASWLHDLDATRRLESDYAIVTLNWVLGG